MIFIISFFWSLLCNGRHVFFFVIINDEGVVVNLYFGRISFSTVHRKLLGVFLAFQLNESWIVNQCSVFLSFITNMCISHSDNRAGLSRDGTFNVNDIFLYVNLEDCHSSLYWYFLTHMSIHLFLLEDSTGVLSATCRT